MARGDVARDVFGGEADVQGTPAKRRDAAGMQ